MAAKIEFRCETCLRPMKVAAEKAGKKLRCPDCQTVIVVPSPDSDFAVQNTASEQVSELAANAGPRPSEKRKRTSAIAEESAAPRRKSRGGATDPTDIWSQPMSSYSSPAIEEHEYEQFGIERPRARSSEADDAGAGLSLKGPTIVFALGMVIGLVAVGLAFASPQFGVYLSWAVIILGALLSAWGHWQIRDLAFNQSFLTGILYLWFFPFTVYFIFSRFSETRVAFFAELLGNGVVVAGIIGLVLSNAQLEKANGAASLDVDERSGVVLVASV